MAHVDPEQEKLYMPSRWVVRVAEAEAVPLHVKVVTEESARLKKCVQDKRLGVRFGFCQGDRLDIYGEESGRAGKMMVFISGGYWQEMSGEISSFTVQPLLTRGHTVVVLDYRRCPGQDLAGITRQVGRGLAWVLELAASRQQEVFLSGHSAGAHLAAMVLSNLPPQHSQRLGGVVHLSGIFELSPLLTTSVNIPAMNLNPSTAELLSPASQTNLAKLAKVAGRVKHWVVVGEHDSPAFKQQARRYTELLNSHNIQARLSEQRGEDHFSLVEKLKDEDYELSQEIINFMK